MRVLVVGLGSIGRRHVRIVKKLRPDAEIFAIRSHAGSDPEEDVMDIATTNELPDGTCDLAIIATPTFLHRSSLERILPAKPFIFMEKPLALTKEDGFAMVEAIEDAKLRSYVGCHLRYHPCLRWLREELKNYPKKIVSVKATCRSWLPDWQPKKDLSSSFRMHAKESGGVHLEVIHEMDYLVWLFGIPQDRTVELRRTCHVTVDAPEEADYVLKYKDFNATIDLSYCQRDAERSLTIEFEKKTLTVDLLGFDVYDEWDKTFFQAPVDLDAVYEAQMRHILQCVEAKAESTHTVRNALSTLTLALP